MPLLRVRDAALSALLLLGAACGGATTSSAASSDDGGGPATPNDAGGDATGVDGAPVARCPRTGQQPPTRVVSACSATPLYMDAGPPVSCAKDSDCADADAGAFSLRPYCLHGTCSLDQCLVDDDCPTATACGCEAQVGGNAYHGNLCLSAQCRTSADCGGGACATASDWRCSGGPLFVCPTAADECEVDADCCDPAASTCVFNAELGHRRCSAPVICSG